jgi:hypothetical protein
MNPVHHRFVNKAHEWPHSSYQTILLTKKTALQRNEVLQWFNGVDEFINFHEQPMDRKTILEMDF